MNFGVIFVVFLLQIILALIVIFFLLQVLGKELIGVALERFEMLKLGDGNPIKEIVVISHAPLDGPTVVRIKRIAERRFQGVSLKFSTDNDYQGGVVIMVGPNVIDCSVKNRLQQLWGG